jgi:uncharacterized protein YggE
VTRTIAILAGLLCAAGFAADEPHTLAVTGTAEVAIAPDICYLSFVVTTTHKKSAATAYRENNELMTAVSNAVKALGIEPKDIQTRDFSLSPKYYWDDDRDRQVFDGYEVSHTLFVSLRDTDKASAVLDAGVGAGATSVAGVSFTVENPKKYLADARLEAIRAARAKAEAMAEVAGVTLLKPITIVEQEPNSWFRYAAQANVSFDRGASGGGEAALEPGQVKLTTTVHITFEIR